MPPEDEKIAKAASAFLATSSERRKRARPPSSASEPYRKKQDTKRSVLIETARKSAADLRRESPSYAKLVKTEEKLDLAIMRKQQYIKETLKSHPFSEARVFRLYIFNTYRSQPNTEGVTPDDVPSWSLRIQGHLLPKTEQPKPSPHRIPPTGVPSLATQPGVPVGVAGIAMSQASGRVPTLQVTPMEVIPGEGDREGGSSGTTPTILRGPPPKCSDVFKRIVIELDKQLYPKNNLIEWKRNDKEPSSDGFEISREGSTPFKGKIYLYVDHKPEQFRLSHALSRLIGVKNDNKKGIFAGVWQYIKKQRLQCVDDRTAIRMDSGLKTLLGPANANVQVLKLQQLFAVIKSHMGPPEPLMIEYSVKMEGDVVDNQDCYDVHVSVQDTSLMESARRSGVFGLELPHSAEFEALREKHLMALAKIYEHKKRREFFQDFSANPVQFINKLILSQTRDLKVLGGSTGRNPEEERRSSFYQQQWVHEAVPRYLLRKAIQDTAEESLENGNK